MKVTTATQQHHEKHVGGKPNELHCINTLNGKTRFFGVCTLAGVNNQVGGSYPLISMERIASGLRSGDCQIK